MLSTTNAQNTTGDRAEAGDSGTRSSEVGGDMRTHHRLILGDSRDMSRLADESAHLVVTSPSYWTLKEYNHHPGQLGHIEDYEQFLDESNAIIKNDMEFILMQRKPGGYRHPTEPQRDLSRIPKEDFRESCQQTWTLTGASTREHPAPFPLELAQRFVRMFSFVGDTVLDPFAGTGTTLLAASQWSRNSIGYEVDPKYFEIAARRLEDARQDFYRHFGLELIK